jgi:hypothetical protein
MYARPARWWREPIDPKKLEGLSEDEAHVYIVQERGLRVAQLQEKIRTLRKFSNDFTAANGYPLQSHDLVRLHPSRYKKLNAAYQQIRNAQSRPHVFYQPRSKRQRAAAQRLAGELIPNQKIFVIHHGNAERGSAKFDPETGEIQVATTVKGGELYQIIYRMPKRPKSWRQVKTFTRQLKKRGMKYGRYRLFTDLYGPIGTTYELSTLEDGIDEFFATYSKYMSTTVLGWLWVGTSLDKARRHVRRAKSTAERFQEARERMEQQREDRVKRQLGIRVPKRRPPTKATVKQVRKMKKLLSPPRHQRKPVSRKKRKAKRKAPKRKK